MRKYFSKLTMLLGVDFHILQTLLMRLWSVVAGGVMIMGIPHWFTRSEQGYFFTFNSLLGLQVFFELGFNYVVVQLVGHEVAHLKQDEFGNWSGETKYIDRMASLISLLQRWYRVIAVLFFIVVSTSGFVFFKLNGEADVVGWQFGWVSLVLFSAINLYLSPFLAVVEGTGQVGHVARLRLFQSIAGYIMLWICLWRGAGLWAVPMVAISSSVGSAFWLIKNNLFVKQFSRSKVLNQKNSVNWRTEIFPFQWRIALSWMSGYFIFQLFNPIIFADHGPAVAGKVGLALTIFSTILSLSVSWVTAKTPVLANHIARKDTLSAKRLFWSLWVRSGAINIAGCMAVPLLVWLMRIQDIQIAQRVADEPILICVAIATIANHFIFSAAAYMRAHKVEPMLLNSIVVGILTLLAVYFGSKHSIEMAMYLYLAIVVFVSLPWTASIFYRFYRS